MAEKQKTQIISKPPQTPIGGQAIFENGFKMRIVPPPPPPKPLLKK